MKSAVMISMAYQEQGSDKELSGRCFLFCAVGVYKRHGIMCFHQVPV